MYRVPSFVPSLGHLRCAIGVVGTLVAALAGTWMLFSDRRRHAHVEQHADVDAVPPLGGRACTLFEVGNSV